MKNIKTLFTLGFVLAALVMQSCLDDFQEINTNPNSLNDTRPEFLFTSATENYTARTRADLMNRYATTMVYMQYIVGNNNDKDAMESPYIDPDKTTYPNPGGSWYNDHYTAYGRDFNRLLEKIDAIEDPTLRNAYENLYAVTRIMETYDAWKIADAYGAMPYAQAFKPNQFPTPEFDYVWDLYKTFDENLKTSAATLSAGLPNQKDFSAQDFFYYGDTDKWLRFANTLRIKIAQRFEERDAAHLKAVLADIADNFGGKIISSNEESFGYDHPQNWNTNIDDIDQIQNSYVATYPFVEFLKSTDDPRLPLLVRSNDWGTNDPGYNDVVAGGTAESLETLNKPEYNTSRYMGKHVFSASTEPAYDWWGEPRTHTFTINTATGTETRNLNFVSLIQTRLFVKNGGFKEGNPDLHSDETVVDGTTIRMRTPLLTYAGACFMMAEIAENGDNGLGKGAAEWYNAGVTASFEDYKMRGIQQGTPNAATADLGDLLTRYPYNGLASTYSQAWVHFLTQPEEAWAMWKRTGYPQFEDYTTDQPSKIGDGSGIAYLESLNTGSKVLLIPRRAVIPTPSLEMTANLERAIADLKSKDPAFGNDRLDTSGRVWWDVE